FWFQRTAVIVPNHYLSTDPSSYPPPLPDYAETLAGRSMLVRKARRIDVECVVRGYLAGSAWSEYRQGRTVCGECLPPGLQQSEKLAQPIFTPATKASSGHDQNVSRAEVARLIGADLTAQIERVAVEIYARAHDDCRTRGLILADTKMEFG